MPVLPLDLSTHWVLCCTWTCLDKSSLCCFHTYLHYRCLCCTQACLHTRAWASLRRVYTTESCAACGCKFLCRGIDLHL